MLDVLATGILSKAGEQAVAILAEALRRENQRALTQSRRTEVTVAAVQPVVKDAIRAHLSLISSWCSSIAFSDLPQRKLISQIFVELDTYLVPVHRHVDDREKSEVRQLMHALVESPEHTVILGSAGAGKTTALKKVAFDYFQSKSHRTLLNYNFPILIELRELPASASATPLLDRLQEILFVKVQFPKLEEEDESLFSTLSKREKDERSKELEDWRSMKARVVTQVMTAYLDELNAVLLLDGYDEIASPVERIKIITELDLLTRRLRRTRILITSRSVDFSYASSSIRRYEIAPLSLDQLETFAQKWLGPTHAPKFLEKVKQSPFADTTIRPLTVAHLCAIYERIEDIPDKPKSVYRRIVNLLLKEWDEQRLVKRTTAYANFDVDRKEEFLSHIAYLLTSQFNTLRFDSELLRRIYNVVHDEYSLPSDQAAQVIAEIESHNGIIVRGGYDTYEFAHKSLQEFLAANYVVRLPSLRDISERFKFLANELAIATALSSKPSSYLQEVMRIARHASSIDEGWYSTFVSRLVLEKTDLAIGHTTVSTVSALQALSLLPQNEYLISAARRLVQSNAWDSISRVYAAEDAADESVKLRCQLASSGLPSELAIPRWLADAIQCRAQ
jgi:predicted NACHT family NTPase